MRSGGKRESCIETGRHTEKEEVRRTEGYHTNSCMRQGRYSHAQHESMHTPPCIDRTMTYSLHIRYWLVVCTVSPTEASTHTYLILYTYIYLYISRTHTHTRTPVRTYIFNHI